MQHRRLLRLSIFLASLAALAAAQDWFPLAVGNQWVYQSRNQIGLVDPQLVLAITGAEEVAGNLYYIIEGADRVGAPPRPRLIRARDDGRVVEYDRDTGQELLWYDFTAPEGAVYENALPYTLTGNRTTVVVSRSALYDGPLGRWEGLLRHRYPPGITSPFGAAEETFFPYVGIIHRSEVVHRISASDRWLTYARLSGVTSFSAPELLFELSLDKSTYSPGEEMLVHARLRNVTFQSIRLRFPQAAALRIEITGQCASTVSQAATAPPLVEFSYGERNWPALLRAPSPPGRYLLRATLATDPPSFTASAALEVR